MSRRMITLTITVAAILVASLCQSGCSGSSRRVGDGPTGPVRSGDADQSKYKIGPGDMLEIFVWRNPEISTTIPVRPDGRISTPLVEDMVAVGKTPSELARDMEAVLSTFIRSPSVNVIVKDFHGIYSEQVRVVGQAVNPRSIPFREGMTVLDLVIEVGGLGEFAAGNRAKLVRNVEGGTIEYRVRLDDLLNKGRIKENFELQPGDVLIIPETFF